MTEMWERFSYYGMRALLVLYLVSEESVGGLAWTSMEAGLVYANYTSLVYLTPLLGGLIADRFLGFRKAVFIGGLIMALGHASLALESMPAFYLGLGCLVIGNGLFKPNIASMVGQLYPDGSPLKDSGYTIFYMGVNMGAFFGSLVCGYLGEVWGWHYGFGAAGIGMTFGLLVLYLGQAQLGDIGVRPTYKDLDHEDLGGGEVLSLVEKQRLAVVVVLAFFTIVFWLAFEQAGSSMNIFALRYTDRNLEMLNFEIPASWFQSVNAFFIITLAPLFSWLWIKLERHKLNPSGPLKFSIGLLLLSLGFVALVIGAAPIPQGVEKASVGMHWLILAYLLHTMGELCLSPVGMSFVSKLSPKRLLGLMFGVWYLSNAVGNYIGGVLSGYVDEMAKTQSLSKFFMIFVLAAFIASVFLALLSPLLKKWMHEVS